ncbi:phage holin family protein [Paenibacillus humicus]|uniref:phage holin family protein n=1 Tax=Paenibacillus humicus TaxID=412861 RepID=UPI003F181833
MDWTLINGLIRPELAVVLAVCWVVGYILKRTPRVPDWSIIYFVTLVAVIFVCLSAGWSAESILQGILVGAVAIYGNQLYKQATKAAEEDDHAGKGL